MTVFIAHAPADREVAEALESFLERRGQFAELEDGEIAPRPLQFADVVVALVSQDSVFSPYRLRFNQRALDAWADGRLVLVKLDHHLAPVGLRDLPAIDASFVSRREFTWNDVERAIREKLNERRQAPADPDEAPPPSAPPEAAPDAKKGEGNLLWTILLLLPGVVAVAAAGSIWLVNRIGPRPGTMADLAAGIDALGAHYGLPSGVTIWVFVAAWVLMAGALISAFARRKGANAAPAQSRKRKPDPGPPFDPEALFVSYARANAELVLPVIDAASQQGSKFWLDREGIGAGDNWAGQIVRAIKGAKSVMVMCSPAAFESDHVKREVYLADRYNKRLLPVFIEAAEPPEDFEYFFADVQPLNLFETPEAERSEALIRAMGAA